MQEKNGKQKRMLCVPAMMLFFMAFLFCTACGNGKTEDGLQEIELAGAGENSGTENSGTDGAGSGAAKDGSEQTVYVYVCGAVNSPGVYELAGGSRVFEALALAGGVTEDAAPELVSQARAVEDGEQIYVPTREEAQRYADGGDGSGLQVEGAGSYGAGTGWLNPADAWNPQGTENSGKVNINTAGKEELMTLTGIGEAKAQSIIAYREKNGRFQSVEEIMEIEGIKEGVFNKIKDDITI